MATSIKQALSPTMQSFPGLQSKEAEALQRQSGKNLLKQSPGGGMFRTILDIVKEPMFLLLLLACLLYFLLKEPREGLLMFVAMISVAAISLYQEVRSGKALEALKKYTEPKVRVIRDGMEKVILSEDLVPGDIFSIEEGKRVPADGLILEAHDLTVDESILTGESVPVEKIPGKAANLIFQGTTINSGTCYARVTFIGNDTRLGQLGRSINTIAGSRTLLQIQISRFLKGMAFFGISAFLLVWIFNYLHSGDIARSLLLGLTLAMSAIPEEIPVAFSSFMALGAFRMSRLGIIVRQPQTVENLGAVNVICLDKTGTITANRMRVSLVYDEKTGTETTISDEETTMSGPPTTTSAPDTPGGSVLWFARLASEPDPFDAMEKAIVEKFAARTDAPAYAKLFLVHEYPLEGRPPMMTHVYEEQGRRVIAAKGGPERILEVCNISPDQQEKIRERIARMASAGYRVLGVCSARDQGRELPSGQDDFDWQFEGLIALNDPPKKNVKDVFAAWKEAGIRVKILSGDYAETVLNIAAATGLTQQAECLVGGQVMAFSPEELREKVAKIDIYARMFPEAKLKVVEALKSGGSIVAMTGDGVNDGPALRSAHIGIAMGEKGTDIAREAADLVISDDNLERITSAIQQGRTIYLNLKKAIRYILSIHIPIILTASLPLLLGWKYPTIFSPIHIIFLELIMGPTCSIFYEREPVESFIMKRPPRSPRQGMLTMGEVVITILQGLITAMGILGLYYYFMSHGYSLQYTRTIVFLTLIVDNIFITLTSRSFTETFFITIRYRNGLAPVILILSILFLSLIYFIPIARDLFGLTSVSGMHALAAGAIGLISIGWIEIYKGIKKRRA